jgi:hypothetical protein
LNFKCALKYGFLADIQPLEIRCSYQKAFALLEAADPCAMAAFAAHVGNYCVSARGPDHDRQGVLLPQFNKINGLGVPVMPMGVTFRSAFTIRPRPPKS